MSDTAPSEPTAPEPVKESYVVGYVGLAIGVLVAMPLAILLVFFAFMPLLQNASASGRESAGGAAGGQDAVQTAPVDDSLRIARIDALGEPNPYAPFWNEAVPFEVTLLPQTVTMPAVDKPSIESASVRAATDGTEIAFRITWSDATPDYPVDTARFCDAVALQFPFKPNTNVMMGLGGDKVQILHWKAIWQQDVDEGYQDDRDLYPNTYNDFYWFASGTSIREDFDDPRSQAWLIAHSAGNPMCIFTRTQPVEEAFAKGFGTLTTHSRSLTRANGAWTRDTWSVVIQRPLTTDDPQEIQIALEGGEIAFALWDGSAGNVGGRKMYSNWVDYAPTAP